MNIVRSIGIDSSPDALWPLLTEPEEIRRWNPDIVSEEPTEPGPPGVGTVSRMKIREGSRVVDYESELTAFEPASLLELELRGGSLGASPMRVSYRLRPAGDGTILDYAAAWQPRGLLLWVMTPLFWLMSQRNVRVTLARLKELAEAS